MKLPIKTVLILSFTIIISLAITFIITLSYYTSKNSMTNYSYKIMEHISNLAFDKSKTYINVARDAAELTQRLESKDVVNYEDKDGMQRYFYEQLRINKQFSGIYYAKRNGDFLMVMKNSDGFMTKIITNKENFKETLKIQNDKDMNLISKEFINDTYDPRVRQWYKLAKETKKLIWTEPYVFFTSKKPGITTAAPIYSDDGILKGIVGVDIEIDELADFIGSLKISDNGKVFIMDESLKMISSNVSNIDKPRLLKIDEIEDKKIQKAYNQLLKLHSLEAIKDKIFITFEFEKKNYHALFLPFKINNIKWIIGMYLPENDYLEGIKADQKFNIFITIIIGLLSIIISYIIARKISEPIGNLQNMAHELKELKLNTPSIKMSHFVEINEAIESFNKMKESLKEAYDDTLFRLALVSEYKDSSTSKHIKRIGLYSEVIGEYFGLSDDELYVLKQASKMHDVGKIAINDNILLKPAKLTPDEIKEMQLHTIYGAKILENPTSKIMKKAREISMYHHEKWDGSGYPEGKRGEEIPLYARIVAVVDVFDALVSKRCYKEAFDIDRAKKIIIEGRGNHFDPKCVDAFIDSFEKIKKVYEENYIETL